MNILANVGIVIIIVVVPSSLTTSVELNIHRRWGKFFRVLPAFFSLVTFGLELLICFSLVTDFLTILTKGNRHGENHHHLVEYVFSCSKHLTCKSQVLVRILGVFGKSKPQKMSTQI